MSYKNLFIITISFILFTSSAYSQLEIKPAIGINATNFSEDPQMEKLPQILAGN